MSATRHFVLSPLSTVSISDLIIFELGSSTYLLENSYLGNGFILIRRWTDIVLLAPHLRIICVHNLCKWLPSIVHDSYVVLIPNWIGPCCWYHSPTCPSHHLYYVYCWLSSYMGELLSQSLWHFHLYVFLQFTSIECIGNTGGSKNTSFLISLPTSSISVDYSTCLPQVWDWSYLDVSSLPSAHYNICTVMMYHRNTVQDE